MESIASTVADIVKAPSSSKEKAGGFSKQDLPFLLSEE